MTTLAANKVRKYFLARRVLFPVVATDIIYAGAAAGKSGSICRPLQAGDGFLGFNEYEADNSAGGAGAIKATLVEAGTIELPVTGVDGWDDVHKLVYASDDDTFTLSSTGNSLVGVIVAHVASTRCMVHFDAPAQAFAAAL